MKKTGFKAPKINLGRVSSISETNQLARKIQSKEKSFASKVGKNTR